MAAMRSGLLGEITTSIDTLHTNKMRWALTVLRVVIGITSITGMTSLIRRFDNTRRESFSQVGHNALVLASTSVMGTPVQRAAESQTPRPRFCRCFKSTTPRWSFWTSGCEG
jgi:hypothetical protein